MLFASEMILHSFELSHNEINVQVQVRCNELRELRRQMRIFHIKMTTISLLNSYIPAHQNINQTIHVIYNMKTYIKLNLPFFVDFQSDSCTEMCMINCIRIHSEFYFYLFPRIFISSLPSAVK